MTMTIEKHCFELGILRAAVEGISLYTYFSALQGFDVHKASAISLGLIHENGTPTEFGKAEYKRLALDKYPKCRSYLWQCF